MKESKWRGFSDKDRASSLRTRRKQAAARVSAAVTLHYNEGLTHKEIGDRLGVSTDTVRRLLREGGVDWREEQQAIKAGIRSQLAELAEAGVSKAAMSRRLGVHINTVYKYLKEIEKEVQNDSETSVRY